MLSTPPAMTKSQSPARIARAAIPTASMPDPQSRFTVVAGIDTGMPDSSTAIRPTFAIVFARLIGAAIDQIVDTDQSTFGFLHETVRGRAARSSPEQMRARRRTGRSSSDSIANESVGHHIPPASAFLFADRLVNL